MTIPISRHIIYYENGNCSQSYESCEPSLDNIKTAYNIFIQSLISIGSFHNLTGHVLVNKNFIYVKNPEYNAKETTGTTGYYKYILDGKIYYLESCQYNVIISDFEDSKDLNMLTPGHLKNRLLKQLIEENPGYKSIEAIAYDKIYSNIEDTLERRNLSVNYIFEEYKKVEKGLYRLDILLKDYLSFINSQDLQDSQDLHSKIKNKIDNLRNLVENNEIVVESVADLLQQAKNIFKEILNICLEQFPDIFLTQEAFDTDKTLTVLNDKGFDLYQDVKIGVKDLGVYSHT
jgi:hypothetical protein